MKFKQSYYTVFTDPFESDSSGHMKQIAFSTRSGQALVLAEDIYTKLADNRLDEISEEPFEELVKHKLLVPAEEDELLSVITENKEAIADDRLLYYVIQPTAYCQLGCDYCGQDHKKKNISPENQTKIIERIKEKLIPGVHLGIKIGWFGAEPLVGLREIREMTPRLKALAKEHNIGYSSKVVTNGLSLKEDIFLELVDDLAVRHIEVTLDGVAEFHDQRRHTKQLGPTFEIIVSNLEKILNRPDYFEKNCSISLRCNVDERNMEGVSPLIKLLASKGLHEKVSYFYPIGVYSWGNDAHKKSLTKEEFAEKEIDWLIEMYEHGFKPSLLPGRVKSVCLAVSPTSEMIDAYGNIFNCTEVSYVPAYYGSEYILGNVGTTSVTEIKSRPLADWNDIVLTSDSQCSSCKMLPVCGGACPKSWKEGRRACPPSKFNMKEKLMLAYLVSRDNFEEILNSDEVVVN